ncbi:MAG: hypothetical protein JW915_09605 [Chitinispirillaceae bacterium]|nr:hypothetical protein [Chitinispirillaceae bacterium]
MSILKSGIVASYCFDIMICTPSSKNLSVSILQPSGRETDLVCRHDKQKETDVYRMKAGSLNTQT